MTHKSTVKLAIGGFILFDVQWAPGKPLCFLIAKVNVWTMMYFSSRFATVRSHMIGTNINGKYPQPVTVMESLKDIIVITETGVGCFVRSEERRVGKAGRSRS